MLYTLVNWHMLNIKKQQHNIDWNKNEKKDEVLCDFSIQGSYTQATKYYLLELSPVRLTIQWPLRGTSLNVMGIPRISVEV